jgi:hypothetical protein
MDGDLPAANVDLQDWINSRAAFLLPPAQLSKQQTIRVADIQNTCTGGVKERTLTMRHYHNTRSRCFIDRFSGWPGQFTRSSRFDRQPE